MTVLWLSQSLLGRKDGLTADRHTLPSSYLQPDLQRHQPHLWPASRGWGKGVGHVTSQARARPHLQAVTVEPSGLFPSDRQIPDGSSWAGTPAVTSDHWISSLIAV